MCNVSLTMLNVDYTSVMTLHYHQRGLPTPLQSKWKIPLFNPSLNLIEWQEHLFSFCMIIYTFKCEFLFQKKENAKNRGGVLTQGDKLNIIKARNQATLNTEKVEKSEKKITDYHKQTKVSSRISKPNVLPKRDMVPSRY